MIRKEIGLEQRLRRAFTTHRQHTIGKLDAGDKPVLFKLTYDEFKDIWLTSGKFNARGCKKGQYVMSRYNDLGHYEVGNVFIQLHSENIRQGNSKTKKKFACCACGGVFAPHTLARWHQENCKEQQ